jgi:CheY-like chemotaxis protein
VNDGLKSVLLVDDDTSKRQQLSILTSPHYRCVSVGCAESAILRLNFQRFNVVVTKLLLPGISGLALCEFVHRHAPATKVILLCDEADGWLRTVAEQMGATVCYGGDSNPKDALGVTESLQPGEAVNKDGRIPSSDQVPLDSIEASHEVFSPAG